MSWKIPRRSWKKRHGKWKAEKKIRERGLLITADAKISFFNGTIYFLVYSSRRVNQLHMAGFAYGFTGTGRLTSADRGTALTLPPITWYHLSLSSLFHFICMFCLIISLSVPVDLSIITQPSY